MGTAKTKNSFCSLLQQINEKTGKAKDVSGAKQEESFSITQQRFSNFPLKRSQIITINFQVMKQHKQRRRSGVGEGRLIASTSVNRLSSSGS